MEPNTALLVASAIPLGALLDRVFSLIRLRSRRIRKDGDTATPLPRVPPLVPRPRDSVLPVNPLADARGSERSHDREGVASRKSTLLHGRRPGRAV